MSLIKCQECGKEVSDKAFSCPNCGCPIETFQSSNNYVDESKNTDSVFASVWFTMLSLMFFWPLGLFTMYKYNHFPNIAKVIITIICIGLVILNILLRY